MYRTDFVFIEALPSLKDPNFSQTQNMTKKTLDFYIILSSFYHSISETRSLYDQKVYRIMQSPFCDAAVAKSTVM